MGQHLISVLLRSGVENEQPECSGECYTAQMGEPSGTRNPVRLNVVT